MIVYSTIVLCMAILLHTGDKDGLLPVHEAASHDRLNCFKFLLKNGAKISDKDIIGRTSMHKVQYYVHYMIVQLFFFILLQLSLKDLVASLD